MQLATGASIPILSEGPRLCAADARALRKWSLDDENCPKVAKSASPNCLIWRTYPLQIFGGLAVVIFQGALIIWLLFERHRRKRASEQMEKARVETGRHRENLAHLARVHTVGEMSAALAHEINQPLVAIKNYALAARRRLAAGATAEVGKIEELLDKIGGQASRAGEVLHSLRAMVKKHKSQITNVEVGQLVADTVKLAELESTDADIRIEICDCARPSAGGYRWDSEFSRWCST